jgi:ubiquinone biosynthesis O-methyltransferase
MGAEVLGVDAVARSVAAARAHAARDPAVRTRASYRAVLAEALLAEGARFDGVLSLEVVEHTADVGAFTAALAGLVAPGGLLVMSTVSRTLRSYALGVLAAERLLGLVPPGTHDWARFLTPEELAGTRWGDRSGGGPADQKLTHARTPHVQARCCATASSWSSWRAWCTRPSRARGASPPTPQ